MLASSWARFWAVAIERLSWKGVKVCYLLPWLRSLGAGDTSTQAGCLGAYSRSSTKGKTTKNLRKSCPKNPSKKIYWPKTVLMLCLFSVCFVFVLFVFREVNFILYKSLTVQTLQKYSPSAGCNCFWFNFLQIPHLLLSMLPPFHECMLGRSLLTFWATCDQPLSTGHCSMVDHQRHRKNCYRVM